MQSEVHNIFGLKQVSFQENLQIFLPAQNKMNH